MRAVGIVAGSPVGPSPLSTIHHDIAPLNAKACIQYWIFRGFGQCSRKGESFPLAHALAEFRFTGSNFEIQITILSHQISTSRWHSHIPHHGAFLPPSPRRWAAENPSGCLRCNLDAWRSTTHATVGPEQPSFNKTAHLAHFKPSSANSASRVKTAVMDPPMRTRRATVSNKIIIMQLKIYSRL